MPAADLKPLIQAFRNEYQREPRVFSAPGRVNLIGEHTDYNDGFVLPMALEHRTYVAAAVRTDRRVRVTALDLGESREFDLDNPGPKRRGSWLDYVEGTAVALMGRGFSLRGADLTLTSTVPLGAGLSSSAALEVSVAFTLAKLSSDAAPDRIQLALAGQTAEHQYVGTMCGIMDQFISSLGQEGHALLIDCRSLEAKPVPIVLKDAAVVIINTLVHHELASSEYNLRRAECEAGVKLLGAKLPGIRALRDVTLAQFNEHAGVLPELTRARCRHVISEDDRTLRAVKALEGGDLRTFGQLMFESHASLRDDYAVSCKELDFLVAKAREQAGVLGARMTGGGFGGCTVNLVEKDTLEAVTGSLREAYRAEFGKVPDVFVTQAGAGAREEVV
ncbi:MAG: galactokinase [Polyangiaceae bacterium]|nr:galactokinase [Polyangiaceae bacterium]